MKTDEILDLASNAIQAMPLTQWKSVAQEGVLLVDNNGANNTIYTHENTDELDANTESLSLRLQEMPLNELRNLQAEKTGIPKASLSEKSMITGLSQDTIAIIETRKEKATLEDILSYCTKLNIAFQDFLPELFV